MMSYETIDWEAEAKRVAQAFGVVGECEFYKAPSGRWGLRLVGSEETHLLLPDDYAFFVVYDLFGRRYYHGEFVDDEWDWDWVRIGWDGAIVTTPKTERVLELAKGLFHLGLLTPQVEAALEVSVSAHQKLEWTREFDARYEL